MANAARRTLASMFPGFFPGAKHNHYDDFGYPKVVNFALFYDTYTRNSIATAAVDKTIQKTWETNPSLLEKARDGSEGEEKKETRREKLIRERFADLRFWQQLAEADTRSLVGKYAGVILRLRDGKAFDQPVDTVSGGLDAIAEIIPAWEGQLTVSQTDTDQESETYGQPLMWAFSEAAVGDVAQPRNLTIHPDRVVIWSKDGTINGRSVLEACINDLIDIEKVRGGGAEGFWKNAKSAPYLEVDKDAKLGEMAKTMGVKPEELADKMNDQVKDFQKGFDAVLMLQGMTAKPMTVTLPASPEHYFLIPTMCVSARFSCPLKILIGSQSGERASTEDAGEWADTNTSRRTNIVIPAIMAVVQRFERFGILPERDWHLEWTDLRAASADQKMDRVGKMAEANSKQVAATGERVFTVTEMRSEVDKEQLSPADAKVEKPNSTMDDPNNADPAKPGAPVVKPPARAA